MSSIEELRSIVGAAHVLTDADAVAPFLVDWRRRYTGRAQAVVLPATTDEVARIVAWCSRTATPVVPQGGNTGLVGGATPDDSGRAILVSLRRMARIRAVDPANNTLTAEAGCVLLDVQAAARAHDRLFPLSLAAEGSATIGGNLSTNAGGIQVLRYGNARELCLGLEVVLPSGEVWHGLRGLRKDNTGYDLRDLFIGAEGTLGIITAACLKTFPLPRAQVTALLAVPSLRAALQLLGDAQSRCGPTLTGFECFSDFCLSLVERHFEGQRSPFAKRHPHYVLLELSDHEDQQHATTLAESLITAAIESGLVLDAAIAQSIAQGRALWLLRESISEAQTHEGKNIKHDIAVPISSITRFVEETDALLQQRFPGVRMVTFGHLGDGNLHYNVSPPLGMDEAGFLALQPAIYATVHDQAHAFGGSISAEHGIGQLKRSENARYKSETELRLMKTLKQALDPLGIMNPGKMVAS
ncbi:MAG TPA: FAD-binding oxidoreductase [Burkholderiaceae bacterium]|nr:FAD-binding oxidoreductase [Burkholderiaceae bacterium]